MQKVRSRLLAVCRYCCCSHSPPHFRNNSHYVRLIKRTYATWNADDDRRKCSELDDSERPEMDCEMLSLKLRWRGSAAAISTSMPSVVVSSSGCNATGSVWALALAAAVAAAASAVLGTCTKSAASLCFPRAYHMTSGNRTKKQTAAAAVVVACAECGAPRSRERRKGVAWDALWVSLLRLRQQ